MIDLHCHILPGIDDGPALMAESVEMARMAVADGIDTIVATPHVLELPYPPDRIAEGVRRFREALRSAQIPLKIQVGAEVSVLLEPARLSPYTLHATSYILFEFPHTHVPQNAGQFFFNATLAGLKPIIAHPERNPSFIRRPQLLFDLVAGGALVQLTAESLTGGFGAEVRECATYLLRKGMVHFLASDAHSSRHRIPGLSRGVAAAARVVGKAAALKLVMDHPATVLGGRELYA
jgi:protein-tyrosine phosphatase